MHRQTGIPWQRPGLCSALRHRWGSRRRALIAETKGCLHSRKDAESVMRSCVRQLLFSDCRSLCDHLDAETLAKVSDKRLGIELAAIHENLWQGTQRTWNIFPNGGDRLEWISTHTMLSDCLTKSMKPDLLLSALRSCIYQVDKNNGKRRAKRFVEAHKFAGEGKLHNLERRTHYEYLPCRNSCIASGFGH